MQIQEMFKKNRVRLLPALVLCVAVLAGCNNQNSGSSGASEEGASTDKLENEVAIVASGGAFEQALTKNFYDAFTSETGVKVTPVASTITDQYAKAKVMQDTANVQWDIVTITPGDDLIHQDLLAPMPCDELPNLKTYGMPGACGDYFLKRTIGGTVLAYDADKFPEGNRPTSWADFWDVQKFPGPRAFSDSGQPWEVLAIALMADGVQPADLFPMDLDRAFRKLDEIKPYVKVLWKTSDQSQQILRDKEVVMSMMWSGQAINMQNQGLNVGFEWNQAIQATGLWGILKDAPHPNAAKAFLNFFLSRPEAHQAFSKEMGFDTPNIKALDGLSQEELEQHPTYSDNWDKMVTVSENNWVTENRDLIWQRWNEWLVK